jgi:hypothetical protein
MFNGAMHAFELTEQTRLASGITPTPEPPTVFAIGFLLTAGGLAIRKRFRLPPADVGFN